ncbi:hypothetical protein YC2023_109547 [Brassica napus]
MDKERYRSTRDYRDRDSSADRSPEREAGRRHRNGDSKRRDSDHHLSSRRDDREDERDRARERRRSVEPQEPRPGLSTGDPKSLFSSVLQYEYDMCQAHMH